MSPGCNFSCAYYSPGSTSSHLSLPAVSRHVGQPCPSPLLQHKRCSIMSPKIFLALFHHRRSGLHLLQHLPLMLGEPCDTGQQYCGVNAAWPVQGTQVAGVCRGARAGGWPEGSAGTG